MTSKAQKHAAGGRRERRRPRTSSPGVRTSASAVEKAFRLRYPDVAVDPALFRLVGIDMPVSLDAERAALGEALATRFTTR